jgi:hypothetical protein
MGPGFSLNDLQQAGATFTGVVTSGGVMELLQFFQVTAKSGRLDLIGGKLPGSVFLKQGTPLHATLGSYNGIDALVELACAPPPRFSFHADGAEPESRTLQGSAQGILMEVARVLDEKRK